MTAQQYAAIAATCDQLLRAPGAGLERLAVPLLHVVKEHPSWLAQYQPLLPAGANGRPKLRKSRMHALTAPVWSAARALLRSAQHSAAGLLARESSAHVEVLIVSHLTSPSQLQGEEDAYFGGLQRLLRARGVSSTLLLIDHLRDGRARRAYSAYPRSTQRRLLPRAVSIATELRIWWRCLRARRLLRREASNSTDPMVRSLGLLASRDVVRGQTFANLRLHETIARICTRVKPAIIITTHEGDACERLIWHAARAMPNPPLCVGYQHALLLQHAHAIRRCIGSPHAASDPDVILTLGQISHAALAASPNLRSVRLIEYGSHRHAHTRMYPAWLDRRRQCVVLPDSDESESLVLFSFALACAQRCPDMTFVLRPHPIVDFPLLASRHSNLLWLPHNVQISSQTLAQDCTQARYCLYRGSSAAMHAVLFGAQPLYLARPDEMPFDPLFTVSAWRETVTSPEEFVRCTQHAQAAPDLGAAQRAWDECDRYIWPVRPAAIDELLALAGSPHGGQAFG